MLSFNATVPNRRGAISQAGLSYIQAGNVLAEGRGGNAPTHQKVSISISTVFADG